MALPDDLLEQARELVSHDAGKPRQASLRRAVSTAYYALFHLLAGDGAKRMSPGSGRSMVTRVARAFAHNEMHQVCKSIASGMPGEVLQELQPAGFSAELQTVAVIFTELQQKRHLADYDLAEPFTKVMALTLIEKAELAFKEWKSIRYAEEANVFLAALLLNKSWNRR